MILARGSELLRERFRRPRGADDIRLHAEAGLRWLFAAQDSSDDAGVSHSYLIGKRWMRSYPETTGYIIPTLLNWERSTGPGEAARRALRMTEWELGMQLESGAIPDLVAGAPVVFDTGQVLFGFVSAFRETQDERFLAAARAAAAWLVAALDEDGVWRSSTDSGGPGRVYNARAAWAVLEYAKMTGEGHFEEPMRRFLDWTLGLERTEGWYDHNCLNQDAAPLLHTIAYTARGQLESGLILGEQRYIDASRRTVEKLAAQVAPDGRMAGRFDRDFGPAVGWACLTGMAQTSILWRRHDATGAQPAFGEVAGKVNRFLMGIQDLDSAQPGMRGGIRGSFPVNGEYGQWSVLNWATKFFVDALMLELDPDFLHYPG